MCVTEKENVVSIYAPSESGVTSPYIVAVLYDQPGGKWRKDEDLKLAMPDLDCRIESVVYSLI